MAPRAKAIAFGGVSAALACVIMCLGSLIPFATFVCPILCILTLHIYMGVAGYRLSWVWYIAVSFLTLLLCPDKEAAFLFLFLGYYPIVKPKLNKMPLSFVWKAILFNLSICVMYFILLHILGIDELVAEFQELGTALTVVTLLLGNVTFFLLDRLMKTKFTRKPKEKR